MRAHAGLRRRIARRRDGAHALDERQRLGRDRDRVPPHRGDAAARPPARARCARGRYRPCANSPQCCDGRADAIEPGALVGGARRGEGRAGNLLGVEAVGALLRRVAADGQRARQRLRLEAVAEAGEVFDAALPHGQAGGDLRANRAHSSAFLALARVIPRVAFFRALPACYSPRLGAAITPRRAPSGRRGGSGPPRSTRTAP